MAEEDTREEQWRRWHQIWKESGVSGAQWCREHDVKYELFIYDKRRLCRPKGRFLEIKDRTMGAAFEIQGAIIRVDPSFRGENGVGSVS